MNSSIEEHHGDHKTVNPWAESVYQGRVAGAEPCTGPCIGQREGFPGMEMLFAHCHLMMG